MKMAAAPEPTSRKPPGCVVLAAGAGRRFGGAKQLALLGGRPLLEHALDLAARAPVGRRVVVLGSRADEILERIDLQGIEPVICRGWAEGMAAPLRDGISALGEAGGALILLGDQPLITEPAVARVLSARNHGTKAVRATYDGIPGHPVLLERELFEPVSRIRGDAGARDLLSAATRVECGDIADPLDIDTPADLTLAEHLRTARP